MPIYEYQCRKCKKVSEFLVGVVCGKTEIKCKFCGSKLMKKVIPTSFSAGKAAAKDKFSSCAGSSSCRDAPCRAKGICPH
ncbi:MAG: zinc ribbon domain-containing protein [Candidatus Omnitrophota bacterium]